MLNPGEIDKPFRSRYDRDILLSRNLRLLDQDASSYANVGPARSESRNSSKSRRKKGAFRIKGKSEFEIEHSLRAYRQFGLPRIKSALPRFPLKVTEIIPVEIRQYDFERRAFKLRSNVQQNLHDGLSIANSRGFLSRNFLRQIGVNAPYTFDFKSELPIAENQAELFRDRVRFASNRGFAIDSFEQGQISSTRLNELLTKYSDRNYSTPDRGTPLVFIALELEILGVENPGTSNRRFTVALNNAAAYSDIALKDRLDWFPVSRIITNIKTRDQISQQQKLNQGREKSRQDYVSLYNLEDTDRDVLRAIAADKSKSLGHY